MREWATSYARALASLPGVRVSHSYAMRGDCYVHFGVEDKASLLGVLAIAARANYPVHVYRHSGEELRYTLVVPSECSDTARAALGLDQ